MSLTGGFDIVLEIADTSLTETCAGLHARGGLTHRIVHPYGGELFDLVFDAPVLSAAAPQADGRARVVVAVRAVVRARDAADPAQLGRGGVADLTLRARLDPSTAAGAALAAGDVLSVDWSETTAADVSVHTSDSGFSSDATAAILDLLQNDAATVVPLGSLASIGTRAAVPATVALPAGGNAFVVGLDLSGTGGSTAQIDGVLTADWAIALDVEFVLTRVYDSLSAALGALPPPNGTASVVLQDGRICVLPTTFGCAATARQQIQLRRLELELATGKMTATGSLAQVVFGPLGFELDADWSADVVLQVDAAGTIGAAVQNVVVQLTGLASLVDSFAAGQIGAAVEATVAASLKAGLGGPGALDFLDGLIGGLGETSGATLRATSVDVRSDGIEIHGVVDGRAPGVPPVAGLSALPSLATPLELLLTAGASWAPGGELAGIAFAPGDGAAIATTGDGTRLATTHAYPSAGGYTATVTATDGSAAASTSSRSVEVGTLRIGIVSATADQTGAPGWQICGASGQTTTFSVVVTASGVRLAGVAVSVSGGTWSASGTTDVRGAAQFVLAVDQVTSSPASGGAPPAFALGGFDVEASATGWIGDRTRVWIVNCGAIGALRAQAQKLKDEWIARLEGYAALAQIRQQLGLTPVLPGPGVVTPDGLNLVAPPPPRDPRLNDAAAIGAVLATLEQVTTLLSVAPGEPLVNQLLGLTPGSEPEVTLKRLTSLWAGLDRAASNYQSAYGDGPPGER
jgi:hypothetical protein